MSDNELINWINKHFGNDKYEFKYINNYLIGSFLKGTNKLYGTHFKYAFIKIYQEKSQIEKVMV